MQIIPVDTNGAPIQNYIYKMPEDKLSPDVYQLPQIIDQQLEADVRLTRLQLGADDGGSKTATEVSTSTAMANINLIL